MKIGISTVFLLTFPVLAAMPVRGGEKSAFTEYFSREGQFKKGDYFPAENGFSKSQWQVSDGEVLVDHRGLVMGRLPEAAVEIPLGFLRDSEKLRIELKISAISLNSRNDRLMLTMERGDGQEGEKFLLSSNPQFFGSSGVAYGPGLDNLTAGFSDARIRTSPEVSTVVIESDGLVSRLEIDGAPAGEWRTASLPGVREALRLQAQGGDWSIKKIEIKTDLDPATFRAMKNDLLPDAERPLGPPRTSDWVNALSPRGQVRSVPFAENDVCLFSILVPRDPSSVDLRAATLLKGALEIIYGFPLPIFEADSGEVKGRVFSIGDTPLVPPELKKKELGDEGYEIAFDDGNILFLGGKRRGAINAVLAFLEEDLGVRWYSRYLPASYPKADGATFTVTPRSYVPALKTRDPGFVDAWDSGWALRNRTNVAIFSDGVVPREFGGSTNHPRGLHAHTLNLLLPPEKFFTEHPEYFALINGRRRSPSEATAHWCFSNENLVEEVYHSVMDLLAKDPSVKLISISQVDGPGGFCQCEECKKISDAHGGAVSAVVVQFLNKVAGKLSESSPDVKLSTLAYLESYTAPKGMEIHPNVEIWLATDKHIWNHPYEFLDETEDFQAALRAWGETGAKLTIWDYTFGDNANWLSPAPNLDVIEGNFAFLLQFGIEGIFWQDNFESPGKSRGPMIAWALAKKAWNPGWKMEDLIDDFVKGVFGPAAPEMGDYNAMLRSEWKRFHDRPKPRGKMVLGLGFLEKARNLLQAAEEKPGLDPGARELIQREKMSLLYARLERGVTEAGEEAAYRTDIETFRQLATRFGVTSLAEGRPGIEGKIEQWKTLRKRPKIEAPFVPTAPEIDGIIDHEEWAASRPQADWTNINGGESAVSTSIRAMWDERHLYLAFSCDEPNGYKPVAAFLKYNEEVFKDDSVEFFFQAHDVIPGNYEQIVANSEGVVLDSSKFRQGWKSGAVVAAKRREGGWDVEMAIPVASVGLENIGASEKWLVNFGRNSLWARKAAPNSAHSNWSGPNGFHQPDQFGELIFKK